jgi:cobalt-zinc-cadmium efflux system outer membrane protein
MPRDVAAAVRPRLRRMSRGGLLVGCMLRVWDTTGSTFALVSGPAAPESRPHPDVASPPDARPSVVSLEEAVQESLAHAPEVAAAAEAVEQARADLVTASLVPNPGLSADTTLQPFPGRAFTVEKPGGPPQYDVLLTQPIDWLLFGKRKTAVETAHRALDVSRADLEDVRRRRVAVVSLAFFDVLEAKSLLDLAREDREALARVEALTRQRVDIGGSPAVDLDRARLATAISRQELRAAETSVAATKSVLRALLGRRLIAPGFDVRGTLDVSGPAPPPELDRALRLAEEHRPDLVSLRHQVERSQAEARSARAQGRPSFGLQLGYTYQHQKPIGAPDAHSMGAAFALSLPLFDRNQGNIAKAESQARQAELSLEAGRIGVEAEVEQAVDASRAAFAALADDDPVQLQAAESVRTRIETAYSAGGRSLLDVLDAQRAYRDAMRLHFRVQASYWRGLERLRVAVGTRDLR